MRITLIFLFTGLIWSCSVAQFDLDKYASVSFPAGKPIVSKQKIRWAESQNLYPRTRRAGIFMPGMKAPKSSAMDFSNLTSEQLRAFYDSFRDGFSGTFTSYGFKLTESENITIDGREGLLMIFSSQEGSEPSGEVRMLLHSGKIYTFCYLSPDSYNEDTKNTFMQSIRIKS